MARGRERQIERALDLPQGYKLERLANSHYAVVCPDGEPLRGENGVPIQVPFSPRREKQPGTRARVQRAIERRESASTT